MVRPRSNAVSLKSTAINHREGILYVLSQCHTSINPGAPDSLINDGLDSASDLHSGVATIMARGGSLRGTSEDGFIDQVVGKLKEWIWWLVRTGNGDRFAVDAANWVVNRLPELVQQIAGGILSNLTDVYDIAKGLGGAAQAAYRHVRTHNYTAGIRSGHPRVIIQSVRDQLKDSLKDNLKGVVKTGAIAGVKVANPIAGAIVGAIASLYAFSKELWGRAKDLFKLNAVFQQAKQHRIDRLAIRPSDFHRWFIDVIEDLPIISSYCLTMPLTGSYYGFLATVADDGSEMSQKQLKRNFAVFNDIKKWARDFVRGYGVKIYSDDPIVQHALLTACQESPHAHIKQGLKDRFSTTVRQLVNSAFS